MKEKDTLWTMLGIFLRGVLIILGLMIVLTVLASAGKGKAILTAAVWKDFKMIFILSMVILLLLFVFVMVMVLFKGRSSPAQMGKSVLLKDNTLRYETKDENGKKKKVTFSIKTIDRYLDRYGKMRMIEGTELEKRNSSSRSNLNNLYLVEGEKKTLFAELYEKDQPKYVRICRFLESISSYDVNKLYWHLNSAISRQEVILKGDELSDQLKQIEKTIKDEEVLDRIDRIYEEINGLKERIEADGSSDKIRKLYDHYIPMLAGICQEYGRLEASDGDRKDLTDTKNKLMLTFEYVDEAILSLAKTDSKDAFEKLEAAVNDVSMVLKTTAKSGNTGLK